MYRASTGQRFILVVTDDVPNYLVTVLLHEELHEIGEALTNNVFCKHGHHSFFFLFDGDQAFLSSIM